MKPNQTEPSNTSSIRPDLPRTDVNPPRGEKSGFRKITATLPQWAYELLIQESARRKIAGEPNQLVSALMREAIDDYLRKLQGTPR